MRLLLLLALLLAGCSQAPQSTPQAKPEQRKLTESHALDSVDSYLKAAFSGAGESEPGPLFQRSQCAFLRQCKNPKYLAGPLQDSSCRVQIDDLELDGQHYQGEMHLRLNNEGRIASSALVLKRQDGTVLNL